MIFSGVAAATCSMSMPPASEAMNTTHSLPRERSTTRLRYSSLPGGGRLLHEDRAHLLPLRARLVGHELHPEDRPGGRRGLIRRSGRLHAAAFPPAAGVDLRLDDGPPRQLGRDPARLAPGSWRLRRGAPESRSPVTVSLPGIRGSSCRTSVILMTGASRHRGWLSALRCRFSVTRMVSSSRTPPPPGTPGMKMPGSRLKIMPGFSTTSRSLMAAISPTMG